MFSFDKPKTIKLIFKLSPGMSAGKGTIFIGSPFNLEITPETEIEFEANLAKSLVERCPNFVYVNPEDAPAVQEPVEEIQQPKQKKRCKSCH